MLLLLVQAQVLERARLQVPEQAPEQVQAPVQELVPEPVPVREQVQERALFWAARERESSVRS